MKRIRITQLFPCLGQLRVELEFFCQVGGEGTKRDYRIFLNFFFVMRME